jgi:hypothetical protein
MLATDQCMNTSSEIYDEGSEPSDYCNTHPGRPLDPSARPVWRPDSLDRGLHEMDPKPAKEEIHI